MMHHFVDHCDYFHKKWHFLLYHTLHVCDNVSLFMDQSLTFTVFLIVLVILW